MAEITAADEFGRAIGTTIRAFGFASAIEIGSWDGTGSTAVLSSALAHADHPRLVCLESEADRYAQLAGRYARTPWVECVNNSSISRASLTPQRFGDVWASPHNRLRYPEEQVRGWWDQFAAYMATVPAGYLEDHADETYDVALIDGAEFTGWDEFRLLRHRVRCFLLDDVFAAYKCAQVHDTLLSDPAWRLVWCSAYVRHGASIWVRA